MGLNYLLLLSVIEMSLLLSRLSTILFAEKTYRWEPICHSLLRDQDQNDEHKNTHGGGGHVEGATSIDSRHNYVIYANIFFSLLLD